MKRTIVIGFADADGQSAPQIICGPEVDENKQWAIFSEANDLHKFPKGIKRVEIMGCEVQNIAIFISEKVAEEIQDAAKKRQQQESEAQEKRKKELAALKSGKPIAATPVATSEKPTGNKLKL